MIANMTYIERLKMAKKQWLEQIDSLECMNFKNSPMYWARLTCDGWNVKVEDMLNNQASFDIATDALRDMLDDVDGDYDIHNFIDDVAIRYDVEKKGLLDWYDNEY